MSSHHSQRFFHLHHQQVATGRERKQSRFLGRLESFRERRNLIQTEVRADYLCGVAFGFLCFLYMAVASVVYLKYIISA